MSKKKKAKYSERGYNKLRRENALDYLIKLSNRVAKQPLDIKYNLFDVDINHLEKCTRQFLIQRTLYTTFNERVLTALGRDNNKLSIGLPDDWLSYLENEEGFIAKNILNNLRWYLIVFIWYSFGVFKILELFFNGITQKKCLIEKKPFVYFDNLSVKSIPLPFPEKSKTVIDWYINKNPDEHLDINHNVVKSPYVKINNSNVFSIKSPVKTSFSKIDWFIYLFDAFWISLKVLFQLFRGDFYHAILLKEYPLIYLSKKDNKTNLGKRYFFHNSTAIFRPLWTYEAEKRGAEIIFYYYSTNNSPLKFDKDYFKEYGNREFMTWSKFYVWNKYQETYVKDYFPNVNVEIVGPIWFESSPLKLGDFDDSKKIVSVFDIQTIDEPHFQLLGIPDRYTTTPVMIQFQKDIKQVFDEKNVTVVLKRKRNSLKSFHDQKYLAFVDEMYADDTFVQISPNVDAYTIIKKSFLTINFPPTSTANISYDENVNTIYYDPTRSVDPNDKSLSGIKLIKGVEELNKYVTEYLGL